MPAKINLVQRLQHWMDSVPGQTFLNYAYSWGASIVILGALFKLTHLPGGNIMLFFGMGTEVVVFFLSAFDRPFDKSEEGKELPHIYETDEQIAARLGLSDEEEGDKAYGETEEEENPIPAQPGQPGVDIPQPQVAASAVTAAAAAAPAQPVAPVVVGVQPVAVPAAPVAVPSAQEQPVAASAPTADEDAKLAADAAIKAATPEGAQPFENEAQRLAQIIRLANDELLHRAQAALSPEMEEATEQYIEKLKQLSETFAKVDEQSARLTKDSEEMENLNRTLTGINKVYELHLKGISLQVGTIDQINNQTQKLAQQIEELNRVYGRMIEALTVNMRGQQAAPAQSAATAPQQ